MIWREQIARLMHGPGWRRYAPAFAAVVAHAVVFGIVGGWMAVAAPHQRDKAERVIELDLSPDPAAPMSGVTPPPRDKQQSRPERSGETPASPAQPQGPTASPSATPEAVADPDGVYLGPPPGLARGLASLMGDDPCAVKVGPKPAACAGRGLADRIGPVSTLLPPTPQQTAQFHGAYMKKCPLRTGCEGGEWISTNGTRAVGRAGPGEAGDRGAGTPMAAGASTIGGLSDSVGRLGFRRDTLDPGFGD